MLVQRMLDAVAALDMDSYLSVPILAAQYLRLKQLASQHQTTGEALVQSWIAQHLTEQKTAP